MKHPEINYALKLLNKVPRFQHVHLPSEIFMESTGAHTVGVWSRVDIFREGYPKKNNIDWDYSLKLASHHDERERFFGDRVAFEPIKSGNRRNQEIRRTVQWLKQKPEVADMVISYENTVDVLKGRSPIRPCRREEILVATEDLIDAADVFHLKTISHSNDPEYARYFPLPTNALVYAPKMLLRYLRRIPALSTDARFNRHIRDDITRILHAIVGWWSVVPQREIPLAMQTMLTIVQDNIPPSP